MKAEDVVRQLAANLPRFSSLFTTNTEISNVVIEATTPITTTLSVTTSTPHGLSVGKGVNIQGVLYTIDISSFTRVGTIGTIVTTQDHDFTLGQQGGALSGEGSTNAITSGADQPEFNGTFKITGVLNRQTIQVEMEDAGPTAATGLMQLNNGASSLQQYNGLFEVIAVPTDTSFSYVVPFSSVTLPLVDNAIVKGDVRISATNSLDSVVAAYTEQAVNNLWMFVVLEDVVASKDRRILSDATENIQRSQYYRQQITQPVTLYVIFPTAEEQIAGRQARDIAEELFQPICRSILFKRFNSLLTVGEYNPLNFISHGFTAYNSAYYVHQYTFEQVADITFPDTVGLDEDVAFRDIALTMGVNIGTAQLTANIDLDEEPLT